MKRFSVTIEANVCNRPNVQKEYGQKPFDSSTKSLLKTGKVAPTNTYALEAKPIPNPHPLLTFSVYTYRLNPSKDNF